MDSFHLNIISSGNSYEKLNFNGGGLQSSTHNVQEIFLQGKLKI